jgi:hypothetical protein
MLPHIVNLGAGRKGARRRLFGAAGVTSEPEMIFEPEEAE